MRKIILLTALDFDKSMNQRTHHMIRYLQRQAVELTVVHCKYGEYPAPVDITVKDNVTYIGIVVKSFNELFNPLTLYNAMIHVGRDQYDVCVAESPWAGLTGAMLKQADLVKTLVYEDLDWFPGFFHGPVSQITEYYEKICIEQADLIFSTSKQLQKLRRQQIDKNVIFSPNGVDYKMFYHSGRTLSHHPILLYSGSLEEWAGLEETIQSLPFILSKFPEARMYIVGTGTHQYALEELCRQLGLEQSIQFLGRKPYTELPELFAAATVGMATFQPVDLMKYAFALKIMEYMASGLPVVATDIGETGRVIRDSNAGVLVRYKATQIAQAVISLLNDQTLYQSLSRHGTTYAASYDWKTLLGAEYEHINEWCKQYCV